MPIDNPLQVVASAVTPVVLVSATAILIGGVNARHVAIADRIRSLTAEFRNAATISSPARGYPKAVADFPTSHPAGLLGH
jgi:hypothetical protein